MFDFNPLSPEFQSNPYQYYNLLLEHMPMFYWDKWNMWFFSRYEDCSAVLRNNHFGHEFAATMSEEERAMLPTAPPEQKALWDMQRHWMLLKDPPSHTRLRMLVHKAFTPRTVEQLRVYIQRITDELIDGVQGAGRMDLIEDLAFPLPVTVISELLGIAQADREQVRLWSRDLAVSLEFIEEAEPYNRASVATEAFDHYLRGLIAEHRAHPREDLISALVAAEEAGDKLTEDEMIATIMLLFIAGHETTVNLIGNGTLALLRNPAQFDRLKADPALVKNALEELLRYDSPVQITTRITLQDTEINGQAIKRGQSVATMLGAANRDPRTFANPDQLDITRGNAAQHIGFGNGIHYCLGAPLARLEAEIAFGTLLRRLPKLALGTDDPVYRGTYVLRGMKHFPVVF
ncbi:MAG: cytochrome P450 [Anaerolineae bacterium]